MEIEIIPFNTARNYRPTISFSKSGLISLSTTAVLKLNVGDTAWVSIGRDKSRKKDWYLIVHMDETQGMKARKYRGRLMFNCSGWTKEFLKEFSEGGQSTSVPLATEGEVIMEGKARAYAILTSALKS